MATSALPIDSEAAVYQNGTGSEMDIEDGGVTVQNGSATREIDRFGFLGGSQYTDPNCEHRIPVDVLRKREVKWLDMLENWEKWMSKRFRKVKDRCRKGIPPSIRPRAWQYLCGSKFLLEHNPGRYQAYLEETGNAQCLDDIRKDLDRQFPLHEIFMARGGHGQKELFHVLKAYTLHNPADGYCQAQAPIAAVLLMHMPAEQAFWCLVSICDKYLPGYYSAGLEAVQIDGEVLFRLLKRMLPQTYKHLKKQKVEPVLYMTEWFMCVFSRTLPWSSVLRMWDMFLCEGVKVMFRIALVLFKHVLGRPDQLAECPSMYETVEKLRHIPAELMEEDFLVQECLRLPITERDMEREHQTQLLRWKLAKDTKSKSAAVDGTKNLAKKSNKKKTSADS
jgi:hypothetical protein